MASDPAGPSLDLAQIRDLARKMRADGVTRLSLTLPGGEALRLVAGARLLVPQPARSESRTISAPGPGRLLLAHPSLPEPPLAPGAQVQAGQIVAFAQAGDMLRPILAPAAGRISRILVPPGTLIGFGTDLFKLAS